MAIDPRVLSAAIEQAAQKYQLPLEGRAALYAMAKIESGFGRNLVGQVIGRDVSGAAEQRGQRATGPFQFMPSTAASYGLKDPMDPYASADAAARHLIDAHKQQGDWFKAAVGHHSGPAWRSLGKWGHDYAAKLSKEMPRVMQDLMGVQASAAPSKSSELFGPGGAPVNKYDSLFDSPPARQEPVKQRATGAAAVLFGPSGPPANRYESLFSAPEAAAPPPSVEPPIPGEPDGLTPMPQAQGKVSSFRDLPLLQLMDRAGIAEPVVAGAGGFAALAGGAAGMLGQAPAVLGAAGVPGFSSGAQDNMLTRFADQAQAVEAEGRKAAATGLGPSLAFEAPRMLVPGGPLAQAAGQGAISFLQDDELPIGERLVESSKDALSAGVFSTVARGVQRALLGPKGSAAVQPKGGEIPSPREAAARIGTYPSRGQAAEDPARVLMEAGRLRAGEMGSGMLRKTADQQLDDVTREVGRVIGLSDDAVGKLSRRTDMRPLAQGAVDKADEALKALRAKGEELGQMLKITPPGPQRKELLGMSKQLAQEIAAADAVFRDATAVAKSLNVSGSVDPQKLYRRTANLLDSRADTGLKNVGAFLETSNLITKGGGQPIRQVVRIGDIPLLGIPARTVSAIKETIGQYPADAANYVLGRLGVAQGAVPAALRTVSPEAAEHWTRAFDSFYKLSRNAAIAGSLADQYIESEEK